jgi:hypothetical protein
LPMPQIFTATGLRHRAISLFGFLVLGCASVPEANYAESVTLEGALHCCMIVTDPDIPEPTVVGWYVVLGKPMMVGRQSLERLEIFPIYRFQVEELERFDGRSVKVSGFVEKAFLIERDEWIYGIKLISIEAVGSWPSSASGDKRGNGDAAE